MNPRKKTPWLAAMLLLLGGADALGQDAPAARGEGTPEAGDATPGERIAINSAVTALGVALGVAAAYNYTQASLAYQDYLREGDATRASQIYDEQVRPRAVLMGTQTAGSALLLGAGAALWLCTDRLPVRRDSARPWGRIVLDGAVTGAGLGLGALATYNFIQGRKAYEAYLAEPGEEAAKALYDEEVRPRSVAAITQAAGAVVLFGSGVAHWATTHLQVSVGPGQVGLSMSW